jgi:uncharacterized protein (DUF1778 family)
MESIKKRNQYEFDKRKYDHVHAQLPKGAKSLVQAAADKEGLSLNAFINRAVLAQMGLDEWPDQK